MGLIIESGTGNGNAAEINDEHQLLTRAVTESHAAHISDNEAVAFSIVAIDVGPVAGEYTLYFQNTSSELGFVLDSVHTNSINADVIWKLHHVTGTSTGTVITPVNLNLTSGKSADCVCRGGAVGVGGLTSSNVIATWYNGVVYNQTHFHLDGTLILGQNNAIALEYDAGTGGAVSIVMMGHYH